MKPRLIIILMLIAGQQQGFAQLPVFDSTVNNLILPPGYNASEYGAIPEYYKTGKGKEAMILIPGLGFDANVFRDFTEYYRDRYRIFVITIPGYGDTKAPALPEAASSYGEQRWNNSVMQGLLKLMDKERLKKVIIVGHATQGTQLSVQMAVKYPDKISRVIVLGGHAKFISVIQGTPREFSLDTMIMYTDRYTSQKWFKNMTDQYFDDNNYSPSVYSIDTVEGRKLWKQVAAVQLPVLIQYLCEFFASDIKSDLHKIKCPTLILKALFNGETLNNPVNNYVRHQFIDAWNDASRRNTRILVKDVRNSGVFVWKDNPKETYSAIDEFLK